MKLVRLSFIAAKVLLVIGITSSADLAALDFDIETIEVSSKHNIDVIPFSIEASNVTKLLIIETPEINQLEKQIQGLGAEPIRTIKIFQRSDSEWNLMLEKALDDSMDLVDTIKSTNGIQLVGLQDSQLVYLDEATSVFKPFFKTSSMFSGRSWGSSPLMDMFTDINGDGLDDFLMPNFDGWAVALQQERWFSGTSISRPPTKYELQ